MNERLFDVSMGALGGIALCAVLLTTCHDRQLRELKDYSHKVATSAGAITARARAGADSARRRADALERQRQPIVVAAAADTLTAAQLERSLVDQRSTADSNVVLRAQVRALQRANISLWQALELAQAQIGIEAARGDSLGKALAIVNRDLQGLHARVEQLTPAPRILRLTWEAVKIGGALYGGYQWGRNSR